MILQLRMPVVEQAFGGGRLVRWHVSPGDTFGPGQRICTVAVERAKLVRRTAEKGGLLRRSNGMVNREATGKGNVYLEVDADLERPGAARPRPGRRRRRGDGG